VTGPGQDVIPLHRRGGQHGNLPVPMERLCDAVQELQGLRECVAQAVRDQSWSAMEWGLVCTPVMLRMPLAKQSLADLAGVRVGIWPDTHWAMRLRTAHDEVERRLMDVSASARSLMREETCTADAAVNFGFEGARLAEALDGLCCLIKTRYPAAVQLSGGR
jgi:hypothetical protein